MVVLAGECAAGAVRALPGCRANLSPLVGPDMALAIALHIGELIQSANSWIPPMIAADSFCDPRQKNGTAGMMARRQTKTSAATIARLAIGE